MKRMNLKEYRHMSDNDIAAQYDDMKITYFEISHLRNSDTGWKGTFELEFPNADGVDYDETMVNNFIVYDEVGKRIAWDNWMPKSQTDKLENIIRQEISKKTQNESMRRIRRIVSETVNRVLKENGNLYGMQKLTGRELYDQNSMIKEEKEFLLGFKK